MRVFLVVSLLGIASVVSGCASIVRGTTNEVKVETVPSGAAIRTSNGHSCPASPCTFKVKRKDEFRIFAEKAGYKVGTMDVVTKVSGKGVLVSGVGNALAGGIVGVSIDGATGAMLNHAPNPAILTLEAEMPEQPTHKKPRAVKKDNKISVKTLEGSDLPHQKI